MPKKEIVDTKIDMDRMPLSEAKARIHSAKNSELTHFMAAMGTMNQDNPFRLATEGDEVNKLGTINERASINYMVNAPDKLDKYVLDKYERADKKAVARKAALTA